MRHSLTMMIHIRRQLWWLPSSLHSSFDYSCSLLSFLLFLPSFVFCTFSISPVEHFMEVTRNLGTMDILDDNDKSRPPLRQNTFVIEDRNVMRLGGDGNGEDRSNGNRVGGQKTSRGQTITKKPPTTMPLAKSNGKTVITSKTDSGLRDDGECGIATGDDNSLLLQSSFLSLLLSNSSCCCC